MGALERGRISLPLPLSGPRTDASLTHLPHFGHPKAGSNVR